MSESHPIISQVAIERWHLARPFVIARGSETAVDLVVVRLRSGDCEGVGESCPVPHYGESPEQVVRDARTWLSRVVTADQWATMEPMMPPGAARNALDCAFRDLQARMSGTEAWRMLKLSRPEPLQCAFTLDLSSPAEMARRAVAEARDFALLKLKLDGTCDVERVRAVRSARPDARLIVDANEAWSPDQVTGFLAAFAAEGVEMVEQPLPAANDAVLAGIDRPVPVVADESCHVAADVRALGGRYDGVNIKLDKTGGVTEALRLKAAAREAGMSVMVGCMLGTSLAMAPAMLVAQGCEWVDLDGPLLIGADRTPCVDYARGLLMPVPSGLWG
ncbi:hypothetical protein B2G71_14275 [Novosphingobium sp. PC22D]|uniref:N-acetyl-D-Glu racemase DgcA n=1 Tax=Novosphingobium sp. PC22D TaxID=1962403 RepID=UPI000BFAD2DE|nr:N-acetyl-D-Glu racemase DgcA [Novosphingobium sp. PC22D]PEQ11945.1 hypothetical protein B2G71_14275 [Novosphingobium sp. PC22D]